MNANGCADIYVTDASSLNFTFFYDLDGGGPLQNQLYYISFFESTNGLNALKNFVMDVDGYIGLYSIQNGNEQLIHSLKGEIDGLVHHSDISWDQPGEEAIKAFKKGDKVKARILVVDIEKERISLGIKQLSENPAGDVLVGFRKNEVVTCKVIAVDKDGIEVELSDGVKSYIKRNELSRDRQDQRPERFAVGDRVDAKVVSVDKKTMKVAVSIKMLEQDEHKRAIDEYGSSDSGASLGDILGAALEEASTKKKPAAKKKAAAEDEDAA